MNLPVPNSRVLFIGGGSHLVEDNVPDDARWWKRIGLHSAQNLPVAGRPQQEEAPLLPVDCYRLERTRFQVEDKYSFRGYRWIEIDFFCLDSLDPDDASEIVVRFYRDRFFRQVLSEELSKEREKVAALKVSLLAAENFLAAIKRRGVAGEFGWHVLPRVDFLATLKALGLCQRPEFAYQDFKGEKEGGEL
jgi:hypothetical protein